MKTRNRYRPGVERLESVNLLSAVPGVAHPAHSVAPTENPLHITFSGSIQGSLTKHEAAPDQVRLRGPHLAINGVGGTKEIAGAVTPVGTHLTGELTLKSLDRGGKTIGELKIEVKIPKELKAGAQDCSYTIKSGAGTYQHASGSGQFTLSTPQVRGTNIEMTWINFR